MAFLIPVLLNLSVAIGTHIVSTPPHPPAPKEQQKAGDYTIFTASCVLIYKYSCWAHAVMEISLLVASALVQQYPDSKLAIQANHTLLDLFLLDNSARPSISYPPLRVFGALLSISANCGRYLCFRALGRHFTFHVAILKDHKLITTGPYSIVRHPAYTTAFLKYLGNFLWHTTSGAWLVESRFYERKISWLFIMPSFMIFSFFMGMIITRPQKEDELLRKEFGTKWDQWAEVVPYRLIPGVY
ncbi:hypothetical protein HYPSUDRAFT_132803 [Hypholoma sublateritium FD-334 SS-4]|uniref:Protein-S-isoprenylcysteine O-methyltransferase n=1 Tax=Hypholoma sublateritium (strain FD-334 SS-4) TaxID=945553 RepID=A0A0D2MR54_HYPSF|nr:hypothetical protein HYPSUDRAFT_132803 [Hypholoma sublateritium FD-334 SS-4]